MESENKVYTDLNQKNIDPISFFEKDANFVFIYKKTEKLASAIYMMSNLFSESEPMKWTLRKKVSELISFTLTYKDISESIRPDFVNLLKTKILELTSFLEVSLHGGLISQMNFSIIKQEFFNVTEALNVSSNVSNASKDLFNKSMPKSFFEIAQDSLVIGKEEPVIFQNDTGPQVLAKRTYSHDVKDKNTIISKSNSKKSNRQDIIIGLLKKKKELTIKDISQIIKDCSEKTIQRELNSFISKGVLKRTGVRRWSKYSLNNV